MRFVLYSIPAFLIAVGMALAQATPPQPCQAEQTQLNIVTNNRASVEQKLAQFAVALEQAQKERDALKSELDKLKDAKKDEKK